ncbi:MAG: signal peptide peptidase SppA [Desulfobacteraceae bacterium]|nr:signal peptide peptidase SppA [Desulfobacteraceae bacterium]
MRIRIIFFVAVSALIFNGCSLPKMKLFSNSPEPLRQFTLQGTEKGKVLVITVNGMISDSPKKGLIRSEPDAVQTIVSQLRLAEEDDEIKAVVLKIDSPGGTVTASDILYHEITAFKERTKIKLVAVMMNLATSGGVYIALPADCIIAHPTTVTGSVGVLLVRPRADKLMEKIGLDVGVIKSGKNKDMGSPFRKPSEEEQKIIQGMIDNLAQRFLNLVEKHRKIDKNALAEISSARIYIAGEAQKMGLIDEIGYLNDAISKAKSLAELPDDAKVVVYRQTEYPDDNIYNSSLSKYSAGQVSLVNTGLANALIPPDAGFYYLWMPGTGKY